MKNIFTYTIDLRDRMSPTLRRVGAAVEGDSKKVRRFRSDIVNLNNTSLGKLSGSFSGLFRSIAPLAIITTLGYKFVSMVKTSEQANNAQRVSEQKLYAVMRNTMSARREDLDAIVALTDAQQKLGVVGDEVQLAGAQELATYLRQRTSLEKLIPVMNNMLAQQYGINASQEQAINIASMMGKVMDGQVGALSRYGYKFDELQEQLLRNGTEAQRVATLYDVVTSAVGGVNEALAQSPEGKLAQRANEIGELKERVGNLVVTIKTAFSPLWEFIINLSDRIISLFENNRAEIAGLMEFTGRVIIGTFNAVISAIRWARDAFRWFTDGVRDGQPVLVVIAGIITGIITTLVVYKTVMGIITIATRIWAGAQVILNAILTANPIGIIIAAIVALAAIITYLIFRIDGWGEAWRNTVEGCKLTFQLFTERIKYGFSTMIDRLMIGLNKVREGWFKFKNAVGIGDRSQNDQMIAEIQADTERRKREITEGAQSLADLSQQARDAFARAGQSLSWNDKSLSDVVGDLKGKLGISAAGIPGMDSEEGAETGADGGVSGSTANAIATGGSKTTHITINLDNLVGDMTINSGNIREGGTKIRDVVLDELSRVLSMAQANG